MIYCLNSYIFKMQLNQYIRIVIVVGVIALAVLGIVVVRGLYADGSYILYQLLSTGTFANIEPHRKFSQALTQVPTWLAMNLGVTDLNLLIRLHSVGTGAMAVLVWAVALMLQLRSPLSLSPRCFHLPEYQFWLLLLLPTTQFLYTQ